MAEYLTIASSFTAGLTVTATALWYYHRLTTGSYDQLAGNIIQRAELEMTSRTKENELTLKQRSLEHERDLERLSQHERKKIAREDERLKQREDKIESRLNLVEKKLIDIEKREAILIRRKQEQESECKELEEQKSQLVARLEAASGLSQEQAKALLLEKISHEVRTDAANLTLRIIAEKKAEADREATSIIATAISRLATSHVADATVTTVSIPSDEIKGRIIGREGRNIRSLELATGVTFLMDDTPGAILLSAFDPVRKQIAKQALQELIADGRIHPTRIEEVVEKATKQINVQIKQYGEDAVLKIGAPDIHPELITLLGKLKFRHSHGQNILDHSLEVAYILGIMASELGLNTAMAKRIGLLHDMGKAVSHEIEGSHALVGADLAKKYGESAMVINGIGCHHNEISPLTVEGSLCGAADAISAARPGVRIEAIGLYIKRLQKLEEIAFEFPGVEKAYALQAGREVRITVLPDLIDDLGAINLARDISRKIQNDLSYPGRIKVTVIREKRVVDYAV